ncbi:unnamed protein product [Blepharisma stoltei]|uniref:Uncharacterized protein n=1 Tax=Blepharisma stoltei TaxID=1481888 RepID=A0AAU9JPH6_9CILI|nr:unnamed protein product [Blepharisma stoltei]
MFNKSNRSAMTRQKTDKPNKSIIWNTFFIFFTIITTGSFLGFLVDIYYMSPKILMKELDMNNLTGPKWYMQNCLAFAWIFKILSVTNLMLNKSELSREFFPIIKDIGVTIAFWLEYYISLRLFSLSDYTYKLSGHTLILTSVTCMILVEAQRNFLITGNIKVKRIGKLMMLLNSYILFWTSFAYHSYIELLSALMTGIFTACGFHLYINEYLKI